MFSKEGYKHVDETERTLTAWHTLVSYLMIKHCLYDHLMPLPFSVSPQVRTSKNWGHTVNIGRNFKRGFALTEGTTHTSEVHN